MFSRRIGARVPALAVLVVMAFFAVVGSALANEQPSPVLEKVTPSSGCPETPITLTGKKFGKPGTGAAWFTARVVPFGWPEEATITSETTATTRVPIFLALTGLDENGRISLQTTSGKRSNQLPFTLTALGPCFKGLEGKEGKEGPQGKEGKEGPFGLLGPPGKEGKEGPEGKEGKEGKEGAEGKEGKSGFTVAAQGGWENPPAETTGTIETPATAELTTPASGGVYATGHVALTALCPESAGINCDFRIGLYVDGKPVPGSGQFRTVAHGSGLQETFDLSGVEHEVAAGKHTVTIGYNGNESPNHISSVGSQERRVTALAFG